MVLTKKQTTALDLLEDSVTNEILYGGAAGGGKSVLGCYWQIRRRLRYPGTRGLIGRSVLKTLKETTLLSLWEVAAMMKLSSGTHYKYNQQSSQIEFKNGSLILLKDLFAYPNDPNFDELGSLELTDAFIDEASQVTEKAKNIVMSRLRLKLDQNNLIPKLLMTSNPAKNYLYQEFYKPHQAGNLTPDRMFIQALVGENSHVSKHYLKTLGKLDKNSIERLLRGNWEYTYEPTALIEYDKIIDCFTNVFLPGGERYITADIARFGSDKIVIGVWDGWRVELHYFSKLSLTETSEKIQEFMDINNIPLSNVLVDSDGVGGGAQDILKCHGFINGSVPLDNPVTGLKENYVNLKSQCYFKLADRINKSGLYIYGLDIESKQQCIEELEQVKMYQADRDTKMRVTPKDQIKQILGRSPDFADTLMMREWFELAQCYTWVAF